MIRADEIQEKLLHLIGWEQSYDTAEVMIADELTKSESGLYFQQAHPLITLQNLASIAPNFTDSRYSIFNPKDTYKKGIIVKSGDSLFRAKQEVQGIDPGSNEAINYWEETNLFSEWLKGKTKSSIQKAINKFCNEKAAFGTAKFLCENKTLFDGTGRITDLVKNKNNIVGFEIVPVRAKGVTTKINRIGLQFTKPGDYTLYLMHSSSYIPIKEFKFTKLKGNTLEWFTLDNIYLPYQSDEIDAGGSWYLVYLQSELPEESQAIRKDRDWSKGPCKSCSRSEFINWSAWSKYLEIHPFSINEEAANITNKQLIHLWDIENNVYTYDSNYGINLDITVSCDYTDFIVEQRSVFQDIILKQVAIDMLREMAYNANTRTNRHAINASKLDILLALEGNSQDEGFSRTGLTTEFATAMKAVKLSTQGLDRVCLPCSNNGIKYRSI